MKSPTIALMSTLVILLASACTSAPPVTEPVAVIEAFYEALNDGDVDSAMGFIANDVSFSVRGAPNTFTYTTKAEVQDHLQQIVDRNTQYELSDLTLNGDTVTWTLRATSSLGVSTGVDEAVVQGGEIVSFQCRLIKDS